MHTFDEIREVVEAISYKPGWSFRVEPLDGNGHYFIQVCVDETADAARDIKTGVVSGWRGGKMLVSQHMTRNEIVRTAHKAVVSAEMHELDEHFRYRGRAIFNPHLDPDRMVGFAGKLDNFEFRADSMMLSEDDLVAA